ncbi:hypothetical protein U0F71_11305 [Burkholderia pseudomallei]|nr:hypothetical protein [Burkholderia pseudomallei]
MKHLVGYDSLDIGRVSSGLVSFSLRTMCAETSDGLIYRLVGKRGGFWDVVDVWDIWFEANSAGVVKDVTERLLAKPSDDNDAERIRSDMKSAELQNTSHPSHSHASMKE